jgi:hypothetical protein
MKQARIDGKSLRIDPRNLFLTPLYHIGYASPLALILSVLRTYIYVTQKLNTARTEQQSARNIIANEPLHTDKKYITELNTQTPTTPKTGNMYNFIIFYFYK